VPARFAGRHALRLKFVTISAAPRAGKEFRMSARTKTVSGADPRWDGNRVAFEIEVEGHTVPCAISRSALQDLGGYRHYSGPELLRCFANARPRIEAIAADKFSARPESVYGVVSIWSDDLDEAPPVPAAAQQAAQHA